MSFSRIIIFLTFNFLCIRSETIKYNSYRGCPITNAEYEEFVEENIVSSCVTEFEPCDPNEGRRIDGSCNNLKHPSQGAPNTPLYRILPAEFHFDGYDYESRRASDGGPLPSARFLRTSFLPQGKRPGKVFTQLLTFLYEFFINDVLKSEDTINYIFLRPYCCLPKGLTDPMCRRIEVPELDPIHRFSNIRCLNLTTPITYQSIGCIHNNSVPERISLTTPTIDLSNVYGTSLKVLAEKGRKFERGLLKYDVEDGRIWPPSEPLDSNVTTCVQNRKPLETKCYQVPDFSPNFLFTSIVSVLWWWRYHNHIAEALSNLNPCWSDNKTFYVARDITIASWSQIMYYEVFAAVMGKENMLKDNILSPSLGFRDLYNETKVPKISTDFIMASRWFHKTVDNDLDLHGPNGTERISIVDNILRTGWLAVGDNVDRVTQALFRQVDGGNDIIVTDGLAERNLGGTQKVADLFSSDLTKDRLQGFAPYLKYVKWCSGKTYTNFDDLKDLFEDQDLEMFKMNYKKVEDIDLLSGLWLEKSIEGGHIPKTLYCIIKDQLLHLLYSDNHWFERPNRPHAFTENQLMQIRKSTMSGILCAVGDKVTEIQLNAFFIPGPNNTICSCDEIPRLDFSAWKDPSCDKNDSPLENEKDCLCEDEKEPSLDFEDDPTCEHEKDSSFDFEDNSTYEHEKNSTREYENYSSYKNMKNSSREYSKFSSYENKNVTSCDKK